MATGFIVFPPILIGMTGCATLEMTEQRRMVEVTDGFNLDFFCYRMYTEVLLGISN